MSLSVAHRSVGTAFARRLLLRDPLEDGVDESLRLDRGRSHAQQRIVPDGPREKAQDLRCVEILANFSLALCSLNEPGSLLKARLEDLGIIGPEDLRMRCHQTDQFE